MPFTDFRSNASWQAAISLGPSLVRLAEELPASEQLGLAWQLQQAMVEVPTAIAFDLQEAGRATRLSVVLKLAATLDLIERVYPALDTAATRRAADALIDQVSAEQFDAAAADANLNSLGGDAPNPGSPAAVPPIGSPVTPAPLPPQLAVPVTPDEAAKADAADKASPVPVPIMTPPITPTPPPTGPGTVIFGPPPMGPIPAAGQDDHVHPDSSK